MARIGKRESEFPLEVPVPGTIEFPESEPMHEAPVEAPTEAPTTAPTHAPTEVPVPA